MRIHNSKLAFRSTLDEVQSSCFRETGTRAAVQSDTGEISLDKKDYKPDYNNDYFRGFDFREIVKLAEENPDDSTSLSEAVNTQKLEEKNTYRGIKAGTYQEIPIWLDLLKKNYDRFFYFPLDNTMDNGSFRGFLSPSANDLRASTPSVDTVQKVLIPQVNSFNERIPDPKRKRKNEDIEENISTFQISLANLCNTTIYDYFQQAAKTSTATKNLWAKNVSEAESYYNLFQLQVGSLSDEFFSTKETPLVQRKHYADVSLGLEAPYGGASDSYSKEIFSDMALSPIKGSPVFDFRIGNIDEPGFVFLFKTKEEESNDALAKKPSGTITGLQPGKNYCISFYARSLLPGDEDEPENNYYKITADNSTYIVSSVPEDFQYTKELDNQGQSKPGCEKNTTWHRFFTVVTPQNDTENFNLGVFSNKNHIYRIAGLQIEEGNYPTAYTKDSRENSALVFNIENALVYKGNPFAGGADDDPESSYYDDAQGYIKGFNDFLEEAGEKDTSEDNQYPAEYPYDTNVIRAWNWVSRDWTIFYSRRRTSPIDPTGDIPSIDSIGSIKSAKKIFWGHKGSGEESVWIKEDFSDGKVTSVTNRKSNDRIFHWEEVFLVKQGDQLKIKTFMYNKDHPQSIESESIIEDASLNDINYGDFATKAGDISFDLVLGGYVKDITSDNKLDVVSNNACYRDLVLVPNKALSDKDINTIARSRISFRPLPDHEYTFNTHENPGEEDKLSIDHQWAVHASNFREGNLDTNF